MNQPKISIVIATFNSANILPKTLTSIENQDIDKNKYEVILVDGFSKDSTRDLVKKFSNVRVVDNPLIDPVSAKFLGLKSALGEYIIYLDHDEVLMSATSLSRRLEAFESCRMTAVLASGYVNPPGYSFIGQYINSFGDPFSAFFYTNLTKDARFFNIYMQSKHVNSRNLPNVTLYDFTKDKNHPLIEFCALGAMVKKSFLEENVTEPWQIPIISNVLFKMPYSFGILKDDSVMHYSSESFLRYLQKIKWRIRNNVFNVNRLGDSGFSGRSDGKKTKKYFFIPYNILILPLLAHAILMSFRFRDIRYMVHVPLSLITCFWILFYYATKILNLKVAMANYDGSKR